MARPSSSVTKPPVFEHKIQTFLKQNRKSTCTAVGYRLGFPKSQFFVANSVYIHGNTLMPLLFLLFLNL